MAPTRSALPLEAGRAAFGTRGVAANSSAHVPSTVKLDAVKVARRFGACKRSGPGRARPLVVSISASSRRGTANIVQVSAATLGNGLDLARLGQVTRCERDQREAPLPVRTIAAEPEPLAV